MGIIRVAPLFALFGLMWGACEARAHEHSARQFRKKRQIALAQARATSELPPAANDAGETCQLKVECFDRQTGKPLAALLRITNLKTGKVVRLAGEIERDLNWYTVTPSVTVSVPRTRLRIEAVHGLETELMSRELNFEGVMRAKVDMRLPRIFDPRANRLYSGNTHVHLMKLTHAQAVRYLRLVPATDGLDLIFVSHLRRLPDERVYITNEIVENSLQGGELARLAKSGRLYAPGQEHRHNFTAYGEGYGHVMLLNIVKLIRPVSIGPGIMNGQGTDGIPLQRGIQTARRDGATVIWCHNQYGMEDVPNWTAGLVHAQNIFDGSATGNYGDSYYKYLNLGLRVPFSTGTDWFIFDFSRVYVPVAGKPTTEKWLHGLRQGKSYITNGPFLEFSIDGQGLGDTLSLSRGRPLRIQGRGWGRHDFRSLQVVHNGRVVETVKVRREGNQFLANIDFRYEIDKPGWFALRIPLENGKNEFGHRLFAHTSPIYVEIAGKRVFVPSVAEKLISEIQSNVEVIRKKGKFADQQEREAVLKVHRKGVQTLKSWLRERRR